MKLRKPTYKVTYSRVTKQYAVIVEGRATLISKKDGHWYSQRKFFVTLRDAIINVAYGI